METLGKSVASGRVFISGEYWMSNDTGDPKQVAQEQGFGILFANGEDLTVVYSERS